ncbi:hypothetical protein BDV93DRAFT_519658 [Ceratobasidium sp. AG-I]|nr:hypothetical protein BDV93DRAFT_519658 [Ceratobasidium sp. AG-I]
MAVVVRTSKLCRSVPAASAPTPDSLASQRSVNGPRPLAVLAMRARGATSTDIPCLTRTGDIFASGSSETSSSSSSGPASTPPPVMPPLRFNMFKTRSTSNSNATPSHDQFRTIGIVGGILAGIALLAIAGIVMILVRNQRARSSTASSSTRSRTNSRPRMPNFLTRETGDTPITRPPPLRIFTGAPTVASNQPTTATVGHHGGMLRFPMSSGLGSASSGSTGFRHPSTSTGHEHGQETPRRAPHLPSLGLNQPRPFLRSFGSLFSYHASAGHAPPAAPEPEASPEPETDNTGTTAVGGTTDHGHTTDHGCTTENGGGTTSLSGSKTMATTEESGVTVPIEDGDEPPSKPQ